MSIETYTAIVIRFYIGLFLFLVFAGIAALYKKIRKKPVRCWWLIPYSMIYSIFALFSTFIAAIAYDDPADPNYRRYQNWELHDFIFNDMKMLMIWLLIGESLYFLFERKHLKIKKNVMYSAIAFLAVLFIIMIILFWVSF